ncbi:MULTISPECIES: DUF2637 domain-containing protein [unclassified Streptomyces]|uniref:DUF2637 domain-containing protein n=1 Tax=unclassified Streptomyces TaxID=2593676 RepID=UPI0024748A66|nr:MULTISPECIES: DUF2637 domain-containing protein [unclassified Streptomyces]MDH6449431.1 hypothetical protein [Streptomyces sp. SAI-119]MDH6499987.1 hypothetical protein [Streptomyces sp. SAI-149]
MNGLSKTSKTAFGLVLLVALALSWWSLYTLAVESFGVPKLLAAGISVAFDGAALVCADLASKYARSPDSGLATRLATYGLIGTSAFLNVSHAQMLGFGTAGQVLFGAPPVIAGVLFELGLKWEHRQSLRERGRVAEAMPVFGKLSWLMFPRKTLKGHRLVLLSRLEDTVRRSVPTQELGEDRHQDRPSEPETATEAGQDTRDRTGTESVAAENRSETSEIGPAASETPSAKTLETQFPEVSSDMSIAKLVALFHDQGVTDREALREKVSAVKGTEIPKGTINKSLSRMK